MEYKRNKEQDEAKLVIEGFEKAAQSMGHAKRKEFYVMLNELPEYRMLIKIFETGTYHA